MNGKEKVMKVIKSFGILSSRIRMSRDFQIALNFPLQEMMEYFSFLLRTFANILKKYMSV